MSAYAGFHAAAALSKAGHRVRGLTRDTESQRASQMRVNEVRPVEGDLGKPETYRQHLQDCEVVVHSMLDPQDPQGTDGKLFRAITEVAESDAAPYKRLLVYTTGCSIYGKRPEKIMDETTPANPDHVLAFRMELEKEAIVAEGFRTVVLRPGFMYGQDGYTSVSGDWFEMGEEGNPVYRGDPEKGWSWVHIADLADAYVRAAESGPWIDGEVFCVADEQRPKCLEVMEACVHAAGHKGDIQMGEPKEDDVTSTWFDQNEFIISQKARRLLGWFPRHAGILDDAETVYAAWKAAQT